MGLGAAKIEGSFVNVQLVIDTNLVENLQISSLRYT